MSHWAEQKTKDLAALATITATARQTLLFCKYPSLFAFYVGDEPYMSTDWIDLSAVKPNTKN